MLFFYYYYYSVLTVTFIKTFPRAQVELADGTVSMQQVKSPSSLSWSTLLEPNLCASTFLPLVWILRRGLLSAMGKYGPSEPILVQTGQNDSPNTPLWLSWPTDTAPISPKHREATNLLTTSRGHNSCRDHKANPLWAIQLIISTFCPRVTNVKRANLAPIS